MPPALPPGYRGAYRTDPEARAVYAEAAGIGRTMPRAVARPADAESVAAIVRWAAAQAMPVIARGSGSSMAGGAIGDGLVIDLGALDAIGPVDVQTQRVTVGAGAIRNDVDAAARANGLRFPVDPSSGAFCTIGGMIGTNAAGARALAFGAMRHSVVAVDCVFADGSRALLRRGEPWEHVPALERLAHTSRTQLRELADAGPFARPGLRKESSGYAVDAFLATNDIVDLVIGSEGTLCLVVAAELALRPVAGATSTILAAFGSLDDAVAAAVDAASRGATACELLDRTFIEVARRGGGADTVPADADAVLLTEVEGVDAADARNHADVVRRLFHARGALAVVSAVEPVAEAELWEVRHAASPTIARLHPELRSMQFIEDGAVPPEHFATYVRRVREALHRHGLHGVIFGHAGDAHAHVNPLVDVTAPTWRQDVAALLAEITSVVAELGGTLAAEHGDGRLRAPLMAQVWPPRALEAFRLIKEACDPRGLLNPGVKIATAGQAALEDIKYDPSLPPLPDRAASVLRTVERTRAYARSRLALLDEGA